MTIKTFYSKVMVIFNDGSKFIGNKVDVQLVAKFTAHLKGCVREILYIES